MSDAAVREFAGRAGIAVEWRDYANKQHRVSAENLRRILAALQLPCDTAADLAQSRRQLETSRLPPLITATTGQPFEVPAAGKVPDRVRVTYEDGTIAELPVRSALRRRATARHRDAGLSRHRVRSRAHHGRDRAAALLHDRGHYTRGAPVGARGASLRPARRRRLRHRRHRRRHRACRQGCRPSGRRRRAQPRARAVCCRSKPFQSRIRRRAGSSTIPFMPTREHCSATLA